MRPTRYFDLILALFVFVMVMSIILAQKIFQLGPFTFVASIILFPISFIIGDILTEVYGFAYARRTIWTGFAAYVGLVVLVEIAIVLPPAPGWQNQAAFEMALQQVPRIVVASMLAYLSGEFMNSYVLAKLKVATKGRSLWMRTIGSTAVGQAVDTLVFYSVAFYGILPASLIVDLMLSGYVFKVVYEAAATPLVYAIVGWLKRAEGFDHFDTNTKFTPFKL